jgi:hypothetical protein
LLAHRAVLSARSLELRDMIESELPDNLSIDNHSINSAASSLNYPPVQLLLPQLHLDSARALLQYVYTDMLPLSVVTDISVLHALAKTGESLRMVRYCVFVDLLCLRASFVVCLLEMCVWCNMCVFMSVCSQDSNCCVKDISEPSPNLENKPNSEIPSQPPQPVSSPRPHRPSICLRAHSAVIWADWWGTNSLRMCDSLRKAKPFVRTGVCNACSVGLLSV